jgi:hypothetical protein
MIAISLFRSLSPIYVSTTASWKKVDLTLDSTKLARNEQDYAHAGGFLFAPACS